jgi:CO/xanthine dehydrogenase Mo-binding subunit
MLADGGAYKFTTSIVVSNSVLNALGPYEIPNVKVDAYDVYTNNVPRGAFRGFGGPQGVYCSEQMVNKLAEALEMDPLELRMRNLAKDGSLQTSGAPYPPGVTVRAVTQACAQRAGWRPGAAGWTRRSEQSVDAERPYLRRGVGLACCHKNVGFSFGYPESCSVGISLYGEGQIERAVIRHGASEVGMGTHTVITQMAAEALGVPMERIELVSTDTSLVKDAGAVSASRMTFFIGNAIKEGALLALEKWAADRSSERPASIDQFGRRSDRTERPVHVEHTYWPPRTTPPDPETGQCDPNVAYAYTANAAEVLVDMETGQVTVDKVYCAIDVGKAINPQQVEGQIQGGLVQSVGYAVLENFIEQDGRVLTPSLSTYLVPTVRDIPREMDLTVMEIPDPRGPWGARGLGEVMNMCLAPAIEAAVHDATGVWYDAFPLIPQQVLEGMRKKRDSTTDEHG